MNITAAVTSNETRLPPGQQYRQRADHGGGRRRRRPEPFGSRHRALGIRGRLQCSVGQPGAGCRQRPGVSVPGSHGFQPDRRPSGRVLPGWRHDPLHGGGIHTLRGIHDHRAVHRADLCCIREHRHRRGLRGGRPAPPLGTALDPITTNNTSVANIAVTAGSDVRITKTRSVGGPYFVGDGFTFILTPSYTGDSPSGLTISDIIPANYTIGALAAVQNGWSCGSVGQTVTCSKGSGGVAGLNQALGNRSPFR